MEKTFGPLPPHVGLVVEMTVYYIGETMRVAIAAFLCSPSARAHMIVLSLLRRYLGFQRADCH